MTTISHHAEKWIRPDRPRLSPEPYVMPWARPQNRPHLASVWRALLDMLAPIGYQDATGFHYGEEPGAKSAGRIRADRNYCDRSSTMAADLNPGTTK